MNGQNFVTESMKVYKSILGIDVGPEDVFLDSLYSVAEGYDKVISWAKLNARHEWHEIEEVAKRDMLSSLPDSIEDLIAILEDSSRRPDCKEDVIVWAKALGAASACTTCEDIIVQPSSFAEAVVDHYGISEEAADDVHERIEHAVRSSGVETGSWNIQSLCAYHDGKWAKDD